MILLRGQFFKASTTDSFDMRHAGYAPDIKPKTKQSNKATATTNQLIVKFNVGNGPMPYLFKYKIIKLDKPIAIPPPMTVRMTFSMTN